MIQENELGDPIKRLSEVLLGNGLTHGSEDSAGAFRWAFHQPALVEDFDVLLVHLELLPDVIQCQTGRLSQLEMIIRLLTLFCSFQ